MKVFVSVEVCESFIERGGVRGFARINFIKLIEFLENILASLSTISMSHMQDVILDL